MRSRISCAGTTLVATPRAVGVEGHELDEAHADALLATEGGEVDDLVVVDAPHHHAVDLHRIEAGLDARRRCRRCTRSRSSRRVSSRNTSGRSESSDTLMRRRPACGEVVGHLRQLHAVGGHGDVDTRAGASMRDEPGQVRAHGGLAAGDPHRLEPEALHAHPHDAGLLLVGEQLVAVEPGHALLGHAVGAAEIAAVGDRQPQVGDPPSEGVDQGLHRVSAYATSATVRPGQG